MGQSWYLAADMQMYLISPLLIYPLWRWRRAGLAWLGFVTLAIHIEIYAIYIIHDFLPTAMVTRGCVTIVSTSPDLEQMLITFYFNRFSLFLFIEQIVPNNWNTLTSSMSNHGRDYNRIWSAFGSAITFTSLRIIRNQ